MAKVAVSKVELKQSFREALKEVEEYKEGKRKSMSWREMMKEITKE